MFEDGHLLLVLRPPLADEKTRKAGRLFWRSDQGRWKCTDLGDGASALETHLDQYHARLEAIEDRLDEAETADEHYRLITEVGALHRSTRHLYEVLQQARQLVPDDGQIIDFRDRAYELDRLGELLYQESKLGLDYAIARRGEQQAETTYAMAVSTYRLQLLAAFFFPIAALAAVFGANLPNDWEAADSSAPLWTLAAVGLLAGAILTSLFAVWGTRE